MTLTDDHGRLPAHATRVLRRLETIEHHNGPSDVSHMQHMEHAGRVRQFADLIAGVQLFADAGTPEYLVVVGEMRSPGVEGAEAPSTTMVASRSPRPG